MTTIYKICERAAWQEAERAGVYHGSDVDRRDSFIHFSTAAQVAETAAKHFAGQTDLMLVAVDGDALGAELEMGALARRRSVSAPLRRAAGQRRCFGRSRCPMRSTAGARCRS